MGSLFRNNDEFGIQEYREDCDYLMSLNYVNVILKRKSKQMKQSRQGDFLGIKTKNFESQGKTIKINIMSQAPNNNYMTRSGYDNTGTMEFKGVCRYDVDIRNDDEIILVEQYKFGLKAGDVFRIKMEDEGLYQLQYTRRFFSLIKIGHIEL